MSDEKPHSIPPHLANEAAKTAHQVRAFPFLVPLRSGWLGSERGVQAKVGWWEGDLCVFPPHFRGNGYSPTYVSSVESFFWTTGGDCVLNFLLDGSACIPQLVEWIESGVRYGHTSWNSFLISSYDMSTLRNLRLIRPDHCEMRLGIVMPFDSRGNHSEFLESAMELGVEVVQGDISLFDNSLLESIRSLGFKVMAENVNGPHQLRQAIDLGLDAVTTRYPERVREFISQLEKVR